MKAQDYDFIAVDVETANEFYGSICQIGVAGYKNGEVIDSFSTLIDSQDHFSSLNTTIHGICEEDVVGSPTFPEVHGLLCDIFKENIVAHHTHFDKSAFRQVCEHYELPQLPGQWLDTAKVARRTWSEFQRSGYGLAQVCEHINFDFGHHDALEDAKACGAILLSACNEKSVLVEDWISLSTRHITIPKNYDGRKEGNPDGPLFGESICFTGRLDQLVRREAAGLAAMAGCQVENGVTKNTTILVQGDQDILESRGLKKSNKMKKAETLAKKGQVIRLLRESDFLLLVNSEPQP